ncbi:c-type cytochrome [Sulfitobacter sp. D35]|uniref:c-type cytochrome n=1 Tax=Sulfitobacter sp. D35 TaxID=3083252 RepID=UPI00296FAA9D|nr:c-type cytochrome [Sulfitobacter sp. D35]MDW4498747.1 c-type cytochrome [Sulfitobacter sp. D35]
MLRCLELALVASLLATPTLSQGFGLGRPALPEEIAAWDLDILPDGTGLPEGASDALAGEEVFAEKCAVCHGDFAEGLGNWPELAGGQGTLDRKDPVKTVGSYWPYLSTVVDYVRRSMPFGDAGTLSDDEVYGVVAYILYSNDLVDETFVLSKDSFAGVEMPNADGFFVDDRAETEYPKWTRDPCMATCKEGVEVTMRARVLDVTPEDVAETSEAATADTAEVENAAATPTALDPALVARGETVFRKCKSCHKVGAGARNGAGPALSAVLGHPMGRVDGFRYSKPMAAAGAEGRIWDEETLSAFLENPRDYMKGTRMGFAGLKKAEERAAVIAYLRSLGE